MNNIFSRIYRLVGPALAFRPFANKNPNFTNRIFTLSAGFALGIYMAMSPLGISCKGKQQQAAAEQFAMCHPQWQNIKNLHFINDHAQLRDLNVEGNTVIWYEMSGYAVVDHEVVDLLIRYANLHNENTLLAGNKYKIIIDASYQNPQPEHSSNYYKKEAELVILKPDSIQPIPLNKHLSYKGAHRMDYTQLYERLNLQLNEFEEVNLMNLRNFVGRLGERSYQGWLVMPAPYQRVLRKATKDGKRESEIDYRIEMKKAKKRLNSFVNSKDLFSQFCSKGMLVTDQQSLRFLGIPDQQSYNCDQNVYLITPQSQNILKPGKQVTIEGRKFNIYRIGGQNPTNLSQSLIFPLFTEKSYSESQYLRFNIDMNQNVANILSHLHQKIGQEISRNPDSLLAKTPKILSFSESRYGNKSSPLEIMLETNNFDKIVNVYNPGCRYSHDEKMRLITNSFKWKYDFEEAGLAENMNVKQLEQWLQKQKTNPDPQYYASQKKPVSDNNIEKYNSLRITGEEYPSILRDNSYRNKVIFHYSEHCFSCKKFKHIYEQIAGERQPETEFYRIDNDQNKAPEGIRNYNSTPIFVMYKQGTPFYFKNTFFTKKIFEDFLDVTERVETFDSSLLEKAVQDRQGCGDVLSGLL